MWASGRFHPQVLLAACRHALSEACVFFLLPRGAAWGTRDRGWGGSQISLPGGLGWGPQERRLWDGEGEEESSSFPKDTWGDGSLLGAIGELGDGGGAGVMCFSRFCFKDLQVPWG